jgi:hypothetical protein
MMEWPRRVWLLFVIGVNSCRAALVGAAVRKMLWVLAAVLAGCVLAACVDCLTSHPSHPAGEPLLSSSKPTAAAVPRWAPWMLVTLEHACYSQWASQLPFPSLIFPPFATHAHILFCLSRQPIPAASVCPMYSTTTASKGCLCAVVVQGCSRAHT